MQNGIPVRPIDPEAVKAASLEVAALPDERRMKELLEALCDPTRVKIVQALRASSLAAGDIAHLIGRTRPATSQHLKVLREKGVVVAERRGNMVRYALGASMNAQVIESCVSALDDVRA